MNRWFVRGFILVSAAGLLPGMAMAQEGNVDQAREALARQEGDEDSTNQLEEVFQAAEKNY
ncbi:MAG: transporter, partial [Pseudomonadota bacterium]|nr:transporter [Pseudomonadota bacterium]